MNPRFHLPFVRYRFWLCGVSALACLLSLVAIVTKGFHYGIDFLGGAKLEYHFATEVSEESLRRAVAGVGLGDVTIVQFGEKRDHRMSMKVKLPPDGTDVTPLITAALEKTFGSNQVTLEQAQTVGPKVGKEMQRKAWLTILFSWVLMLIYIGYRFDFLYAPGAIIALMHDTLITLGCFAWLGKEINLTILAAILTLIGYSINDTIVVFDRIRENGSRITPTTIYDVVNESMNTTLSRTIITSLTVMFVVIVLFFKGGGTLHDFSFAMIIGVFVGTYSSIFVASPIYIGLYHFWPLIRKKRAR